MLRVNAGRGPSTIHGNGLIAGEFIPKGTTVWQFQPGFDVLIPEAKLELLSPAAREHTVYWSYFHQATKTYVMSSDDDRFTNHSDEANTQAVGNHTVAVRDIQAGEEITNNYDELGTLDYHG